MLVPALTYTLDGDNPLPYASHMCTVYSVCRTLNIERRWPGFEKKGRKKEMVEKHAMSRSGSISKHQELVSEGQCQLETTTIVEPLNYGHHGTTLKCPQ